MSKKDKRIKGCPDPDCARHVEHYKYKTSDRFCTLCGSQLVYVCAKCFDVIEDSEDKRRYCENCKPKKQKDGTEEQKPAKEKKKKEKKKEKDKIKEGAKKIASDPKTQRAVLEVAEIAKDGIRNRKVRKAVGVIIRAAKK